MLKRLDNGEIYFGQAKWTPGGTIECLVQPADSDESIWFNATPYDTEDYGRELFEMLSTKYSDQVTICTEQEKYDDASSWVRLERDSLLKQCDWLASTDVELENKNEWLVYRQALRDITNQPGFPFDVVFPTKPETTKNTFVIPDEEESN